MLASSYTITYYYASGWFGIAKPLCPVLGQPKTPSSLMPRLDFTSQQALTEKYLPLPLLDNKPSPNFD